MKYPSKSPSSQTVSILTINVWFGLKERGILRMKPIEPDERREKRYQILVKELRRLQPDFIAIQEANPIPQYSRRLATDLAYDEIHQVYNGGIKIGRLGIPINLRMGLLVLAKKRFQLRWAGASQISGDRFGIYGDLFCFHFADSRFVMAGVASIEEKRLYVVHAHTYAGPSEDRDVLDLLDRYRNQGKISQEQYRSYLSTLRRVSLRQEQEIEEILAFLKRTAGTEPAVLLGDFNLTEDSPLMVHLIEEGHLWDTYRIANPEREGITWDSDHNKNTAFSGGVASTRGNLMNVYRQLRAEYDRKSRRIDYIFLNSAFRRDQILESRVVLDQPVDGVHTSDHYGVMTVVSIRPGCGRR